MNGSTVNILPVADFDNLDSDDAIVNVIHDAIAADADTVGIHSPHFETAVRTGVAGKSGCGERYPFLRRQGKFRQFSGRPGGKHDAILHDFPAFLL